MSKIKKNELKEVQEETVKVEENSRNDAAGGFMTLEFLTGIVVIIVPLLIAVAEVYRVEWAAMNVMTSAQKDCIVRAARSNARRHYKVIQVESEEEVPFMRATRKVFPHWRPRGTHLSRNYWIGTGTAKGIRL